MFVCGKLFQPSLMFVGKARGLPNSGAPERVVKKEVKLTPIKFYEFDPCWRKQPSEQNVVF